MKSKARVSGRVPGTLVLFCAGLLTFAGTAQGQSNVPSPSCSLAVDLFEEGNWASCRTECSRLLLARPEDPQAALLGAVAELRSGMNSSTGTLARLCESTNTPTEVAAMAGYELGRELLRKGDSMAGFEHLKRAFEITRSTALYLRAGCTLAPIVNKHPELEEQNPGLASQLRTSSRLWTMKLRAECAISASSSPDSLTGRPFQWLIAFYRREIGPALGRRCSLTPSCSEYGRQALRRHGVLGLALIGDRTVREPQVVAEKASPVFRDGRWRYSDPVETHDWWMAGDRGQRSEVRRTR